MVFVALFNVYVCNPMCWAGMIIYMIFCNETFNASYHGPMVYACCGCGEYAFHAPSACKLETVSVSYEKSSVNWRRVLEIDCLLI